MRLYLAPRSSLELMRYLRATNGEDGLVGKEVRKSVLTDAVKTAHVMAELDETAQRWLAHAGDPVHAYVSEKAAGTRTEHLVTHLIGVPIPRGALLDIGHGVCICSPQFLFMQMAAQVDFVDAVSIGMELCGSYSRWRLEPSRLFDPYYRAYDESKSCTFGLPAAMRAKRAGSFVERLKGRRGAVGARAAARWLIDHSASPMETAVYLLLCLPKRLGGYGLPKPVLNPKLIVRTAAGAEDRYPDLYWAQPRSIDIEYNSDLGHSGEWSRYRDSKREVELVVANVTVLPLTRHQLIDEDEFDVLAQGLRKMLGVRSRRPDAGWAFRRAELRQKLLSGWD